jgi:hypothetical protein
LDTHHTRQHQFCEPFAAFVEIDASILLEEDGEGEEGSSGPNPTGGFDLSSSHPHLQTFGGPSEERNTYHQWSWAMMPSGDHPDVFPGTYQD